MWEPDHESMSPGELRAHMRASHGFWDTGDDPDWLIDQTHRDEHADYRHHHVHPDLEHEHDLETSISDEDWMRQHGIEG